MPGSKAFKPGDVIKAFNGKSIEILNTDAEGRLILADAIAYAIDRFKPGVVIDLATLTGSVLHALGDKAAGLFSNSESLRDHLIAAAEKSGDYVWPLPLWKVYDDDIKSDIADIKNLGESRAGAIAAAKFLEHFTGKTKWAHIDMAGTAYNVKHIDFLGKGATGYGSRLLIQALKDMGNLL
jgi:leucyl aminopeptidase